MKIATATYPVDWHADWTSYEAKITAWVVDAAAQGATLLVFAEYGAMELASLAGAQVAGDIEASLRAVDALRPKVDALYRRLAIGHQVHILGASIPCFEGTRPTNRAMFYFPDGRVDFQDKQIMTMGERGADICGQGPLKVFDTGIGRIGVIICYDSEFPDLSRALVEAGVEILLAPSCTETLAGYWRVRIGSMARALESQCVVVHSPLIGLAPWSGFVAQNTGAAALYGPPDIGFPETGVLAEGVLNKPGWVIADVSLEAIRNVRANGVVRNKTHWPEQAQWAQEVTIAPLTSKTP